MQKSATSVFIFISILVCSCQSRGYNVYIKIPISQKINEHHKYPVRFRGVTIGKITDIQNLSNDYYLLTAFIDRKVADRFTKAVYRESLIGNAFMELINGESGDVTNYLFRDTIDATYSPLYRQVDSVTKEKIIEEMGKFKKKLDSLLDK